jgi:hypothetical protein
LPTETAKDDNDDDDDKAAKTETKEANGEAGVAEAAAQLQGL